MEEEEEEKQTRGSSRSTAITPAMPPLFSESHQNPDSESTESDCFQQSLKELKDLKSQLYHAADYCENAFLKATSKQKKILLESTKEYVGEVVVTVVDHLGTVSSNLEQQVVYAEIKIPETEQRMDCLKHRLLTYQQYALSLDLASLHWITKFTRHHRRYVSPLSVNHYKFTGVSRDDNKNSNKENKYKTAGYQPLFDSSMIVKPPVTHLTSGTELADVVPVLKVLSTPSKPCTHLFGSPAEDTFIVKNKDVKKKTLIQGSNFLSFLKMSNRRI